MLHRAVQSGSASVVKLLIDANADICARDAAGNTPAALLPERARDASSAQVAMGQLFLKEAQRRRCGAGYAKAESQEAYASGSCFAVVVAVTAHSETSTDGGGGGGCGGGGCGGGGCGGCGG